jgi:thiosulfate/3-mercaptopyruvate sulfurtransferase
MSTPHPDRVPVPPIVDVPWLRNRLATDPTTVVCQVGSTMVGPEPDQGYLAGHLPGARFVSLDDVLAAPPSGTAGRHPLPTPADFASSLGDLGVGDDATVVAYDDRGGALAGRLVWMLRILGQRAALLDGGIEGWLAEPGAELEVDAAPIAPTERTMRDWPLEALADAIDVEQHLNGGGVVIDSRDPARFAGEIEPIDAVAGHVPGAINLLYNDNLASDGGFRPVDELRSRFARAIGNDDRPIVYCGSGVTACHNALAMEQSGFGLPRIYVGSWSGWIADPDRPIATGTTP